MQKLKQLIGFAIRIALCVVVARIYEYHWLSKEHILGYLWILNHFRAKGEDVDGLYERMITKDFPTERAIGLYAYIALVLWFVQRKTAILVAPRSIWDILKQTFWLSVLFATLHLPMMFMMREHWQPYAHNHIHGFFVLFGMNVILNLRVGDRYCAIQ